MLGAKTRKFTDENGKRRTIRGNFIGYLYKVARIFDDRTILRQGRNHWRILQEMMNKYPEEEGIS